MLAHRADLLRGIVDAVDRVRVGAVLAGDDVRSDDDAMALPVVLDAQLDETVAVNHRVVVDRDDVVAVQLPPAVFIADVVAAREAFVMRVVQQCDVIGACVALLEPLMAAVRRIVVDDDLVVVAGAAAADRLHALHRHLVH